MTVHGELRIYLGAAPGAGKTFAMLGEARRRRERGTDVVVGAVRTHGRVHTEELLHGLEIVSRGGPAELDLDAVLDRRPEVVLVDDLAHANAPGSRNAKRWQDVAELLGAGIMVIATVDVAHLESLNDVVERITGVRPAETVPDEVVRLADQVELVDITPEAVRRRLAHGNIYDAEQIDAVVSSAFDAGALTALRELALLWMADHVGVALQRHRADRSGGVLWETRERVVVALSGGPESETVLRRAARIARRIGSADLLGVHVLGLDGDGRRPVSALTGLRRLAEGVGASFHTVVGDDVAQALLDFARGANATQLVLGSSPRNRLIRLVDEGLGARVLSESGTIDVHLVNHADVGAPLRMARRPVALSRTRRGAGWTTAIVLPVAATAAGVAGRSVVDLSTNVTLTIVAIVVVALIGGLGPALFAALVGALALNYFFTEPLYTLTIAEHQEVITLAVGVLVAVLVASLVDQSARRSALAVQARTEAALLASFSRTILSRTEPLPALLDQVREAFGLVSVALLERTDAGWRTVGSAAHPDASGSRDADAIVVVEPDIHLVGRGRPLPAAARGLLETVAGQAVVALRSQRMAADAAEARRRAETTELRTALLSAVGHDLRTPLTSIKAAIGSLRDPDLCLPVPDRDELTATIEESADRLTGLIDNLLDSSRLATGTVVPRLCPAGYDEVVARVLATTPPEPAIGVYIDEFLPDVVADAGLLERVVANVVDNALRHGGGSPVTISASAHADRVELRIADRGPGAPPADREAMFAPFRRTGDRNATSGVGLGLSVARGFTEAMAGTITAEDTPGGGLTVVIALPAAARPRRMTPA
jgi:two-component system, OmpR family, sensor histidine kinase KdpD